MLSRLILDDKDRVSRNDGGLLTHYTTYTITVGCYRFIDFWKKVLSHLLLDDKDRVSETSVDY